MHDFVGERKAVTTVSSRGRGRYCCAVTVCAAALMRIPASKRNWFTAAKQQCYARSVLLGPASIQRLSFDYMAHQDGRRAIYGFKDLCYAFARGVARRLHTCSSRRTSITMASSRILQNLPSLPTGLAATHCSKESETVATTWSTLPPRSCHSEATEPARVRQGAPPAQPS